MVKNGRKSIIVMVIAGLMALVLTACQSGDFDASLYVKAMLDAGYKGEFDDYTSMVGTKDEAKAYYDRQSQEAVNAIIGETGELSEATKQAFDVFFKEFAKHADYKVGEAVKNEGEYEVEVTYRPFPALAVLDDEDALSEKVYDKIGDITAEELAAMTEEEAVDRYLNAYLLVLYDELETTEYGNEAATTMHVRLNEDGLYEVPAEDYKALNDLLFGL